MQLINRINVEDEQNVFYIRIVYVLAQGVILAFFAFLIRRIRLKNDQTELKYTETASPFSEEPSKRIDTTVCEYDISQAIQIIKQTFIGIMIVGFVHYKWGYVQPLILQSIFPFKTVFSQKVVQVYLFGKAATGDLKRPWKADFPFSNMFEQPNQTNMDSRQAERAEKRRQMKTVAGKGNHEG